MSHGCGRSNGAPVYRRPKAFEVKYPAFLYRYREGFGGGGGGAHGGGSGRLIWVIGPTEHNKPQEVNDPDNSASEKGAYALFDSSPSSAEGDCAHNPASPTAVAVHGASARVGIMAAATRTPRARGITPAGTVGVLA